MIARDVARRNPRRAQSSSRAASPSVASAAQPPSELVILTAALRGEVTPHAPAYRAIVLDALRRFAQRCEQFGRTAEREQVQRVIANLTPPPRSASALRAENA